MENDWISLPPDYKLYSDRSVALGTFIGGPLVAGYLAAENFRRLGQSDCVKKAWAISIIGTILIFGGVFMVPIIQKLPRYIIPLAYTLLTQGLVQKFQRPALLLHLEDGGRLYSPWRAVWIGLVGFVLLCGVILLGVMLFDPGVLQT